MIQTTSGGSMGLGFAIPINQVRPIAQTIIAHGKVVHPSIGLTATSVRNQKVLGARVANVVAGSPAESTDPRGRRDHEVQRPADRVVG